MQHENSRANLAGALNPDLELALGLADAADEITMRHYRSASLVVRTKSDRTPVSEADEAVETMIRERLSKERPDDGIIGEEFGTSRRARNWVIDPIDGTRNFVRGVPVWATLIAIENVAAVVSAPSLHRRWWASRGDGAFVNGAKMHVSPIDSLADGTIAYDGIADFDKAGLTDHFLALVRKCSRSRGFGDFWSHMLVAEGAIEIAIEPQVSHWDMAAIQIIVEEAGGRFTSLRGEARADAGSGVSTNGLLHHEVLRLMR